MKVLVGRRTCSSAELLLCRVAWLVSRSLVEVGECVAEPVTKVSGAAVLLLEDWVFDYGCPNGAMLVVTGLEGTVLFLGKWAALLTTRLLKDGCTIRESRADFGGEMGLSIGVVLLIRVGEVSTEAGGADELMSDDWDTRRRTYRSLRSTGERLSKCKLVSFRIAFQLPTPCCEKRNEHAIPHKT